jgi:hypothetical protein
MSEGSERLANALSISGLCRDMRHSWVSKGDTVLIEQQGQIRHFARTLSCFRCGTERIDEYKISNIALERVRSRYRYVEGYHIKGGMPIAEVRFQMFRNMPMVLAEDVRTANDS